MGVVNGVNGGAAEDTMGDNSKNLASTVAVKGFRRLGQLLKAINCMITKSRNRYSHLQFHRCRPCHPQG